MSVRAHRHCAQPRAHAPGRQPPLPGWCLPTALPSRSPVLRAPALPCFTCTVRVTLPAASQGRAGRADAASRSLPRAPAESREPRSVCGAACCAAVEQQWVPAGSCTRCSHVPGLWDTSTAPDDSPAAACLPCLPGHTSSPARQHGCPRGLPGCAAAACPGRAGLFLAHSPSYSTRCCPFSTMGPRPGMAPECRLPEPQPPSLPCPPQAIARSSSSRAWWAPSWR